MLTSAHHKLFFKTVRARANFVQPHDHSRKKDPVHGISVSGIASIILSTVNGGNSIAPHGHRILSTLVQRVRSFTHRIGLRRNRFLCTYSCLTHTNRLYSSGQRRFVLLNSVVNLRILISVLARDTSNVSDRSAILNPFCHRGPPILPGNTSVIRGRFSGRRNVFFRNRVHSASNGPLTNIAISI